MKKKITYLLAIVCIILASGMSLAQNQPIDFESGGFGATWTWTVFENDDNPPVEVIPNPDMSGINTSATVAKFTARSTGQPFAGCESMHGSDLGTFTLDATNSTVKIMVWKSVISDVGIKFVLPNGDALPEIKVANTLINQWEELTFDFSGRIGHPATIGQDQIVIFPDFDARTQENVIYFDNITFSEQTVLPGPTDPAPTPTVPASDVISLFSNAYTNVPVDTWSAVWDNADVSDVQVAGDDVKKYSNLVFAGVEFTSQTIDATGMTNFHMDIWTPDPTALPAVFKIKLVDFGADGIFGGGDDVEHELTFDANSTPALATGEWVSFDIPLSDFTGLTTKAHLAQLVIVADPNTVYVDNVYFYFSATDIKEINEVVPTEFILGQNYPNPFNPTTNIRFSLPEASNVTLKIYNMLGQEVSTLVSQFMNAGTFDITFDAINLPTGLYLYSLTTDNFSSVKKMILIK